MCVGLAWVAGVLGVVYFGIGVWIFAPIMWNWWSPSPTRRATVRSRLERVGLYRWLGLAGAALAVVAVGALSGC
jgi:hypothetical protein